MESLRARARQLLDRNNDLESSCYSLVCEVMRCSGIKSADLAGCSDDARLYYYYEGDGYEGDCYSIVAVTDRVEYIDGQLYLQISSDPEDPDDVDMVNDAEPLHIGDFTEAVIGIINDSCGGYDVQLEKARDLNNSLMAVRCESETLMKEFLQRTGVSRVDLSEGYEHPDYAYDPEGRRLSGEITLFVLGHGGDMEFALDFHDDPESGMVPVTPVHLTLNLIESFLHGMGA